MSRTIYYLRRFPYFWREYGFKLAWSHLTRPDIWEPIPADIQEEQNATDFTGSALPISRGEQK